MCEYIHFCTLTLYLKTTYSTLLTVKRWSMKFLARLGFSRHPNINTESGAPNENILQNHINIALLNVL